MGGSESVPLPAQPKPRESIWTHAPAEDGAAWSCIEADKVDRLLLTGSATWEPNREAIVKRLSGRTEADRFLWPMEKKPGWWDLASIDIKPSYKDLSNLMAEDLKQLKSTAESWNQRWSDLMRWQSTTREKEQAFKAAHHAHHDMQKSERRLQLREEEVANMLYRIGHETEEHNLDATWRHADMESRIARERQVAERRQVAATEKKRGGDVVWRKGVKTWAPEGWYTAERRQIDDVNRKLGHRVRLEVDTSGTYAKGSIIGNTKAY